MFGCFMKNIFIFILLIILLIGVSLINNKQTTGNSINDEFPLIIIPVKAHIIIDSSGQYTSARDEENILKTFEKANNIWKSSGIFFQIEDIVITEVSFNAIPNALNQNYIELFEHENFDKNKINVFFVQSLNGINGLALTSINVALVADFTTVNDFRTTAHELGHILGLRHVAPDNRLMARGRNGEFLSKIEIEMARKNSENLF